MSDRFFVARNQPAGAPYFPPMGGGALLYPASLSPFEGS